MNSNYLNKPIVSPGEILAFYMKLHPNLSPFIKSTTIMGSEPWDSTLEHLYGYHRYYVHISEKIISVLDVRFIPRIQIHQYLSLKEEDRPDFSLTCYAEHFHLPVIKAITQSGPKAIVTIHGGDTIGSDGRIKSIRIPIRVEHITGVCKTHGTVLDNNVESFIEVVLKTFKIRGNRISTFDPHSPNIALVYPSTIDPIVCFGKNKDEIMSYSSNIEFRYIEHIVNHFNKVVFVFDGNCMFGCNGQGCFTDEYSGCKNVASFITKSSSVYTDRICERIYVQLNSRAVPIIEFPSLRETQMLASRRRPKKNSYQKKFFDDVIHPNSISTWMSKQ